MGKKENVDYEVQPFPQVRRVVAETFSYFEKSHHIHSLVEFDVTKPRAYIDDHFKTSGEKLSFTAFIIKCVGKAVEENKLVHAFRFKKKKLIVFNDIDINAIVAREIQGEYIPNICIIRAANKKSFKEIHEEIRAAQIDEVKIENYNNLMKNYLRLPRLFRKLIGPKMIRNPFRVKKYAGTVIVSAVGMFGQDVGWTIPYPGHPLILTAGGITKKPRYVGESIEPREFINITLSFNHDIIDGAPAAQFTSKLKELIEKGFGLI